jgi:hypothetical protein
MAHAAKSIVRQIESVFEGSSVAGLTDRQLLERFIASRDAAGDAAFAALVARYGPMVLQEEIDRLPHAFRSAVVLYYLEGLNLDDAARRLTRIFHPPPKLLLEATHK